MPEIGTQEEGLSDKEKLEIKNAKNIVNKEKESIKNLEYPNNILIEQKEENNDKIEINNMWDCGIRSSYYYLLPIKESTKKDSIPTEKDYIKQIEKFYKFKVKFKQNINSNNTNNEN